MASHAVQFADETLTRTDIAPLSAYDGGVTPPAPSRRENKPATHSSLPPMRARMESGVRLRGATGDTVTAALARDARWESETFDAPTDPSRDEPSTERILVPAPRASRPPADEII